MKNKLSLAISIPTYNRIENLKKLVGSIIEQDLPSNLNINIYIFDNSTNSESEQYFSSFKHKNFVLKYIKNEKNVGIIENIKKAYFFPSEDYVWVIGDDDLIYNDKFLVDLEKIIIENPEVIYFYLDYCNVSNDYTEFRFRKSHDLTLITNCYQFVAKLMPETGWIGANIFRRNAMPKIPMRLSNEWFPHITILTSLMIQNCNFKLCDFSKYLANRWDNRNTTTWSKNYYDVQFSYAKICDYFIKIVDSNFRESLINNRNAFLNRMGILSYKQLNKMLDVDQMTLGQIIYLVFNYRMNFFKVLYIKFKLPLISFKKFITDFRRAVLD